MWTADGTFVNERMVADGFGEAVRYEPNDRYIERLRTAETSARDAGRACGRRAPRRHRRRRMSRPGAAVRAAIPPTPTCASHRHHRPGLRRHLPPPVPRPAARPAPLGRQRRRRAGLRVRLTDTGLRSPRHATI
ncbi:MAG: hypothetical protein KY462_04930 [Actinobacteria bacterium]|nr:hypothetical protein [Actinomycetota bacterium]